MTTVRFMRLDETHFMVKHSEAYTSLKDQLLDFHAQSNSFGEVEVPGHGWYPCVLQQDDLKPAYFYDEDDGWQTVPKCTFEVVNLKRTNLQWKDPCQVPGCHGGDGIHIEDCPAKS